MESKDNKQVSGDFFQLLSHLSSYLNVAFFPFEMLFLLSQSDVLFGQVKTLLRGKAETSSESHRRQPNHDALLPSFHIAINLFQYN